MKKKNRLVKYLSFLFLLLVPSFGSASWSVPTESDLNIESTTDRAICYNSKTNVVYSSLKKALDEATSGQEVVMYIGAEATCSEDITIKSGVTLTIPFLGKAFDSSKTGTNVNSGSTLYKIPDAKNRNDYGNELGDKNQPNVDKYRSILLNMVSGADIVNNGTLNLGGASTYCGNNGYYSEINLGSNSSIICNEGSTFNCYGYIKEYFGSKDKAGDAKNSGMKEYEDLIDNSFDSGRCLLVKSGAIFNTLLAMYDVQSGGGLTGAISAETNPFNVFDFQLIQTYATIEAGSSMNGTALVVGPNDTPLMEDVKVVSNDKSNPALLYLSSGTISFESKILGAYSSRDTNINGLNIVINGDLEMGYLYISDSTGNITMDTRLFNLPMSSKISMFVTKNGTFNCNKKIKFLMGSKLIIEAGGSFYVNENVVFYDKSTAPKKDSTKGITYDSTGKDDATLVVNGTLKINQDGKNNGYLGACITCTSENKSGKLDFSSISNSSFLSASLQEGTAKINVAVTSSGYFIDENNLIEAQFRAGENYFAGYLNGTCYWIGKAIIPVEIKVNVDDSIVNPVAKYTITLSENSNGSSPFNSELVEMGKSGVTAVSKGIYFNLSVTDAVSISISKNGTSITYNSSSWILADGNISIDIVPCEGVEIYVTCKKDTKYNDNESTWNRGTGHVIFYLQVSDTLKGKYEETYRVQASSFNTYVKKGKYFKLGYTWDSKDLLIWLSGQNGFTTNNSIFTNDSNFAPQPATSWNNKSTSNLSDAFLAGNDSSIAGLKYSFELGYYTGHSKAGI